jgi:hypothetical protein
MSSYIQLILENEIKQNQKEKLEKKCGMELEA